MAKRMTTERSKVSTRLSGTDMRLVRRTGRIFAELLDLALESRAIRLTAKDGSELKQPQQIYMTAARWAALRAKMAEAGREDVAGCVRELMVQAAQRELDKRRRAIAVRRKARAARKPPA